MHTSNRLRPNLRAAIGEFVAINAGDHDVFEFHQRQRCCDTTWFVEIKRCWFASLDVAKPTRARAGVAQNHDRRGASAPTFAHVGARRFLTHSVKTMLINDAFEPLISLASGNSRAQPIRLALHLEMMRCSITVVDHLRGEVEQ